MKCPSDQCEHEFDVDEFGSPYSDVKAGCPKCQKKVQAFWDYYLLQDGDEQPFICELEIRSE